VFGIYIFMFCECLGLDIVVVVVGICGLCLCGVLCFVFLLYSAF